MIRIIRGTVLLLFGAGIISDLLLHAKEKSQNTYLILSIAIAVFSRLFAVA